MNWIEWAFAQAIGTPEKLVLVYLASRVNAAGVGLSDRPDLERATGYKPRSVQRLLKMLRERHLLEDAGPWYQLLSTEGVAVDVSTLPAPTLEQIAGHFHGCGPQLDEAALEQLRLRPPIDENAIGEAIANHITDAAEYLSDQLQAFERRFAQQIDRFALLNVEQAAPEPPPPPDPVTENPLYRQLLETGLPESRAYALSKADLELDEQAPPEPMPEPATIAHEAAPGPPGDADGVVGVAYDDEPAGRFERIRDLLAGQPVLTAPPPAALAAWQTLEREENRHTVKGEVEAFLLLYPAIVTAARRCAGRMTLEQFLDPQAIAEGRAPWDLDPAPTPAEDAELEADIGRMLGELAQANDPRCQVGPRTVETKADGSKVRETMLGYHRRVLAKYREMQKLKEMGVLGG